MPKKFFVGIDVAKLKHTASAIDSDGEVVIPPVRPRQRLRGDRLPGGDDKGAWGRGVRRFGGHWALPRLPGREAGGGRDRAVRHQPIAHPRIQEVGIRHQGEDRPERLAADRRVRAEDRLSQTPREIILRGEAEEPGEVDEPPHTRPIQGLQPHRQEPGRNIPRAARGAVEEARRDAEEHLGEEPSARRRGEGAHRPIPLDPGLSLGR